MMTHLMLVSLRFLGLVAEKRGVTMLRVGGYGAHTCPVHSAASPCTYHAERVAGEEQGLFGANLLADETTSADVQGMFTNDIVGPSKADNGAKDTNSTE